MIPKQKAADLVEQMQSIVEMNTIATSYLQTGKAHYKYEMEETAKRCALMSVDEILKATPDPGYWQQVKQEIEKL